MTERKANPGYARRGWEVIRVLGKRTRDHAHAAEKLALVAAMETDNPGWGWDEVLHELGGLLELTLSGRADEFRRF